MNTINLTKQTINLSKNQVINLSKSVNKGKKLSKVLIALGWKEAEPKVVERVKVINPSFIGRLFGEVPTTVTVKETVKSEYEKDLDAWVCLGVNGKLVEASHDYSSTWVSEKTKGRIIYYANLEMFNAKNQLVIKHCGDDLVGGGDGDNEQIKINLDNVPSEYDTIVVGVTIYKAKMRGQSFGDIKDFFVRVVDRDDNFEICRYADSIAIENKDSYTFIVGKLYKEADSWFFKSFGYGTKDGCIEEACINYKEER